MVPDPLPPIHPGDTVHLFGSFAARPQGEVVLELELAGGRTLRQRMEIAPARDDIVAADASGVARSDLARIGAALRLPALDDAAAATELAVRYQLVSEWTDYLVVHVRAEADKAIELPDLVKVPQVLAAGWHGTGTVHDAADAGIATASAPLLSMYDAVYEPVPAICRSAPPARKSTPGEFAAALNVSPLPPAPTLHDLQARGLPDAVIEALEELLDGGIDSQTAALIFLYLLCHSPAGRTLDRQQRRVILSAPCGASGRTGPARDAPAARGLGSGVGGGGQPRPPPPYAEADHLIGGLVVQA